MTLNPGSNIREKEIGEYLDTEKNKTGVWHAEQTVQFGTIRRFGRGISKKVRLVKAPDVSDEIKENVVMN